MSKPTIENFEAMAIRNQLDLLVHQARNSPQDKQQHYQSQIDPLAQRYLAVTGQHYQYEEVPGSHRFTD